MRASPMRVPWRVRRVALPGRRLGPEHGLGAPHGGSQLVAALSPWPRGDPPVMEGQPGVWRGHFRMPGWLWETGIQTHPRTEDQLPILPPILVPGGGQSWLGPEPHKRGPAGQGHSGRGLGKAGPSPELGHTARTTRRLGDGPGEGGQEQQVREADTWGPALTTYLHGALVGEARSPPQGQAQQQQA